MAKSAALTALEPLIADTLAHTSGAETRLVQAIARHLREESPAASPTSANGVEALRQALDAVRQGAAERPGHAATRALLLAMSTAAETRVILAV